MSCKCIFMLVCVVIIFFQVVSFLPLVLNRRNFFDIRKPILSLEKFGLRESNTSSQERYLVYDLWLVAFILEDKSSDFLQPGLAQSRKTPDKKSLRITKGVRFKGTMFFSGDCKQESAGKAEYQLRFRQNFLYKLQPKAVTALYFQVESFNPSITYSFGQLMQHILIPGDRKQ